MVDDPDKLFSLEKLEMPEIGRAASARAQHGKKTFLFIAFLGLASLAISSSADTIDQQFSAEHFPHMVSVEGHLVNLIAIVGMLFLAVTLFIRNYKGTQNLDRPWHASRLMAEEIKSLAWRYAVRGLPYESDAEPGQAEERLRERLRRYSIAALSDRLNLPAPPMPAAPDKTTDTFITKSMRDLRNQPADVRRKHYGDLRIRGQWDYYAGNERKYQEREKWTVWILNGFKVFGVLWAAAFIAGAAPIEIFGITGTIAAAGTSWLLLNQYDTLADTYGMMARLMMSYYGTCADPEREWTDTQWADFVAEVEGVLSEEHVAWRRIIERFSAIGEEPNR